MRWPEVVRDRPTQPRPRSESRPEPFESADARCSSSRRPSHNRGTDPHTEILGAKTDQPATATRTANVRWLNVFGFHNSESSDEQVQFRRLGLEPIHVSLSFPKLGVRPAYMTRLDGRPREREVVMKLYPCEQLPVALILILPIAVDRD